MKKLIPFMILVLLASSLACSLITPSASGGSAESKILFKDDFSSTSSGWDQIRDTEAITDYENNAYRIQINTIGENKNGMSYWASPGLSSQLPADVSIEVDATKMGGPDDNDFGVMCRYTDTKDNTSFYQFMATSDGYVGIVLVNHGDQKIISSDKLKLSDSIKPGAATNHIRADCIGDSLTLYVNGTKAASAQDATLKTGDTGLIAGTYSTPGTDVIFDNFVVSKP